MDLSLKGCFSIQHMPNDARALLTRTEKCKDYLGRRTNRLCCQTVAVIQCSEQTILNSSAGTNRRGPAASNSVKWLVNGDHDLIPHKSLYKAYLSTPRSSISSHPDFTNNLHPVVITAYSSSATMGYPETFEGFMIESHKNWSDFKKQEVRT